MDPSKATLIALSTAAKGQGASVLSMHPVMSVTAIVCAVMAAALLIWFLWAKPALSGQVKVLLLFGFGVFPIGSALTGNVAGFEHTKHRPFCGSCHVMMPYRLDSEDLASRSLAAAHARNEAFGEDNCYECHQEYGAFSTILTKIGGMRHVYHYYNEYHAMDVKTFMEEVEIRKPFVNASCIRCHSTDNPGWKAIGDHRSSLDAVKSGRVSCVSEGCHGPAHPFSKPKRRHAAHAQAGAHGEAHTEQAP